MRKKVFAFAVLTMLATCLCGTAFAENPPMATHLQPGPEMVSFRVWHFPGVRDGVQVSGFYEYFDMMMDLGHLQTVFDTPQPQPVLQASPVDPGGTVQATKNGVGI